MLASGNAFRIAYPGLRVALVCHETVGETVVETVGETAGVTVGATVGELVGDSVEALGDDVGSPQNL
ncbi:Hypothetical Protein FCC1311_060162 [Hondaea fermentalgiana]|uniref:Uncharacterized protein n=1 Tax=Hondaea fermentalgiana TaxID=2315210 RepID=A0A2R5GFW6_9STRA|nr:Hypothetical Protein FCC1311_060162 [Hondaea fermentalgiana]|eukprot:GBG29796.1 Hypothetical Protein FCC1311_060162 [Hondaea fermentalgiana]